MKNIKHSLPVPTTLDGGYFFLDTDANGDQCLWETDGFAVKCHMRETEVSAPVWWMIEHALEKH